MKTTSKNSKLQRMSQPIKGEKFLASLTARDVERMLRADGFRPVDSKTKKRLIASGNWGMPNE